MIFAGVRVSTVSTFVESTQISHSKSGYPRLETYVLYSKCTLAGTYRTMCMLSKKRNRNLANLSKRELQSSFAQPLQNKQHAG